MLMLGDFCIMLPTALQQDIGTGHVCNILSLTHIFCLNIFSSITCVYQKTSVKIMWFWWTVPCPLELLPWWRYESCWWVHWIVLYTLHCTLHIAFFMGIFSFSGPWCTGGQNFAGVFVNGWNGSPFSGLCIPTGQDHHHSCRQEGQRSLPHHTWHWWVEHKQEYLSV